MSRNIRLRDDFRQRYQDRFSTVGEYYEYRRDRVQLVDLSTILPQFAKRFEVSTQEARMLEDL